MAWWLTGSVGLLSDALESLVNLAGALMALAMLSVAARPPDEDHAYGHGKAEYFSAGVEGTLILVAAVSIAVAAVQRLMHPRAIEQVGLGLAVSVVASLVNLGVALVLLKAAREHRSATLQANAHHLLTDVWTSAGVLVGVGAVALTGWQRLDPIVALAVAANIVFAGGRIVLNSVAGLMDAALPASEISAAAPVARSLRRRRHRVPRAQDAPVGRAAVRLAARAGAAGMVGAAGARAARAHRGDIRRALPPVTVFTHLEPLGDPSALDDQELHRNDPP